jgi:outer membrane biosynthesis protein TonB
MNLTELSRFNRRVAVLVAASTVATMLSSVATAGTETVFPKSSKILNVVAPPQCKDWQAPLPDRRTDVVFPNEAKGINGSAALLVRIGAAGEYLGVADFLASDEAYAVAAQEAVKQWTFKPARCNGEAIASDARVDFVFRREGGITYTNSSAVGRK